MISVIVPVYNCENYLHRSIQSLLAQTIFDQLEIVFVDDGSTDRSPHIIQEYIDKYSNMKLIRQSNMGVSAARNTGIKNAAGNYIAFFDSDDIAVETLYEKLLQLAKDNQADLSCVNYSMCFSDGVTKVHKKQGKRVIYGDEIITAFFSENDLGINVVEKLFKAEIVRRIRFPEETAVGEDMFFLFQYILQIKSVAIDTTESLYLYQIRTGSAMKSKFSPKYFEPVALSKKMMEQLSDNQALLPYAKANWIHETCKAMSLYYQSQITEYSEIISEYRRNIASYPVRKAFQYMSKKHFVAFLLMRLSPKLYILVYKMLRMG